MKYLDHPANFEKYPTTKVLGYKEEVFSGIKMIAQELKKRISEGAKTLVIETYVGVDERLLTELIEEIRPDHVIRSIDIFVDTHQMNQMLKRYVTDDRVYGIAYTGHWYDFVDETKLTKVKKDLAEFEGVTLVFGVGATYISKGDVLIYADMTIWEIQMRYRNDKISNFNGDNQEEDGIRKFKRGYFIDWRLSNRRKAELMPSMDYYLDSVNKDRPVMITRHAFENGLLTLLKTTVSDHPVF
jgi:hypothetical protein